MCEINDLCDLFAKQSFDEEHLNILMKNRNEILRGVPRRRILDFLYENDEIIQGYLKNINMDQIKFLKEMMYDYLSVCSAYQTSDLKLDILLLIYNNILAILGVE